jgi:phenylalanyl-tRNA synthetase beta chain
VSGFDQPLRVAALAAGSCAPEQWGQPSRQVDFYDLKADVEALLHPRRADFVACAHPALHPGRAATVMLDSKAIGFIGELHPRWTQKYELGKAPVVLELELAAVLDQPFPAYAEVSRFPAVARDLALVVSQTQPAQAVLEALRKAAPALVQHLELFDVYQGKGLAENQKSLAFHIVMQDTQRTLADAEVEAALATLLQTAQREFAAELRR